MRLLARIFAAAAAAALAGCVSFTPMQTSLFTDENGNLVSVEYGRCKSDRESKFTAPSGKVLTMKSKLAVNVTLPDGSDFFAWECMNTLPSGTMYRSGNERWMYHANGISCQVFEKTVNPQGREDYLLVFEGVICEGPKKGGDGLR
jgi:hypothetical protein